MKEKKYSIIERILKDDNVVMAINNNIETVLDYIPEIKHMKGYKEKDSNLDLWNHTLLTLFNSDEDIEVRLALLLHDIGKPFSYKKNKVLEDRPHEEVSAEMSSHILKRLGYEDEKIKRITYLVANHNTRIEDNLILDNIRLAIKLYKVQYCNILAHSQNKQEKGKKYLTRIKQRIKIEETRLDY